MTIKLEKVQAYPSAIDSIDYTISYDNLSTECSLEYTLYSGAVNIYSSSIKLEGEDYANWNGSNDELEKIVLDKLKLTKQV